MLIAFCPETSAPQAVPQLACGFRICLTWRDHLQDQTASTCHFYRSAAIEDLFMEKSRKVSIYKTNDKLTSRHRFQGDEVAMHQKSIKSIIKSFFYPLITFSCNMKFEIIYIVCDSFFNILCICAIYNAVTPIFAHIPNLK